MPRILDHLGSKAFSRSIQQRQTGAFTDRIIKITDGGLSDESPKQVSRRSD
jgi:hypothetical protein